MDLMSRPHELNQLVRSPNQGKALLIKTKKFRGFNSDWLLILKINTGMLLLSNQAITRLYQITGMLKIPNRFFKETEMCVFIDAHYQKRIQNIVFNIK